MIALQQNTLFEQIDILPIDLKTKLVDRLLSSITPQNPSSDMLWIEELKNRRGEIASQSVALVDGNEVFQKVFQKYKS
jgi:hypothetical protein